MVQDMANACVSGCACAARSHVPFFLNGKSILPSAAGAEGALEAFVSVISGPPGPRPEAIFDNVGGPLLLLWGEDDTVTPLDGPVARFMAAAAKQRPDTDFVILPGARAFFLHLGLACGAWLGLVNSWLVEPCNVAACICLELVDVKFVQGAWSYTKHAVQAWGTACMMMTRHESMRSS